MYVYIHIHINIYIYVYIHIHIHIHTYVYIPDKYVIQNEKNVKCRQEAFSVSHIHTKMYDHDARHHRKPHGPHVFPLDYYAIGPF